ncbi:unnamed protein product [Cladocopium goreaui]|uniref:Non-specific serine/threonine protein kinase n=1 Tax=Cladocopium goreaui TaxID=2562237 RepID=A0A9P1GSJ3_9DINO|nr:unnamed protein product [Cladocopium goreaui]
MWAAAQASRGVCVRCFSAAAEELCRELQLLAARGSLKAAERRLAQAQQAQQAQHGTAGALLAANALPPEARGPVFRCMVWAAINADDADAASRWLNGFSRFLPDASSCMTTLEERGSTEGPGRGPAGAEVLGRLLGMVSEGGAKAAERWFVSLESSGPLAEHFRHRVMLVAADVAAVERSLPWLPLVAPSDASVALEQALRRLALTGASRRVQQWLRRLQTAGFTDYAPGIRELTCGLFAAALEGDISLAEQWQRRLAADLEDAEEFESLNLLLMSCGKNGVEDGERARLWFQRLLQTDHRPNFLSFVRVMTAFKGCGAIRDVESYFQAMIRWRIDATCSEYTILLRACRLGADSQRAWSWLSRMEEVDVAPDVAGVNALLGALAQEAAHRSALEVLKEMTSGLRPFPDASSYAHVLRAFCAAAKIATRGRRDLLRRAEDLLTESREAMLQVDVDAYQQLLRSSTHLGDAECAGRLWGYMKRFGVDPDTSTLLKVLEVSSSAPFLGLAQESYGALPEKSQTEETLLLALRPLAELGDWRGLERMLQRHLPEGQSAAVAMLQLQALSEAMPRKRQRSMDAAGRLLRAGGRLVPAGDEESLGSALLRRALGPGRREMAAMASVPLPRLAGPMRQRQAGLLCASRAKVALDLGDPQRAEGWIHRWLLLQEAGSTVEALEPTLPRTLCRRFRPTKRLCALGP